MAGSSSQSEASLLAGYDGPHADRVRRAIVFLARGDLDALAGLVQSARTDYRDVLAWEQQRRTGVPPVPVDVDRLTAWLEPESGPRVSGLGDLFRVVLLDAGDRNVDLLKALRASTGLGLADLNRLLSEMPTTITSELSEPEARRLSSELDRLGARTDVRPGG